MTLKIIGFQIKQLRISKGLTQEQLASLTGKHRNNIIELEAGRKNVSIKILDKIYKELGFEISEIVIKKI